MYLTMFKCVNVQFYLRCRFIWSHLITSNKVAKQTTGVRVTSGDFQPFHWRHQVFFKVSCGGFQLLLGDRKLTFFFQEVGPFPSVSLKTKNRYFKPIHEAFQTLTKWFLSLNLTGAYAQRCDKWKVVT